MLDYRTRLASCLCGCAFLAAAQNAWTSGPLGNAARMDDSVPAGPFPWPVWTGESIAVAPSQNGTTYYVDGVAGSDNNEGTSPSQPLASISKATAKIHAGDTVLIHRGLYREGIIMHGAPSGAPDKVTTFGSYGDGEVIIDGSTPVNGWKQVGGSVWKAAISFKPIGIVVDERALRQVPQGQGHTSAPNAGVAGVTSGSGKWAFDGAAHEIYADFGASDPSKADVVVPNDNGAQYVVYFNGGSYLTFNGLTVRGSGSNGIWGYSSHVTVVNCNLKFNGKAGVAFMSGTDNSVITSHIYQNSLLNWPRGNNGFAEAGGGWAGGVSWSGNLRPYARGNIVHHNGGEGIISYGSKTGGETGGALFERNVIFDNWSVNLYFDNQPNDVARDNLIYNHPIDTDEYLYYSPTMHPYNNLGKFRVGIMIADEEWSSDGLNDHANLDHTSVYNNIIIDCSIGIRDYAEGRQAQTHHGLRNALIANNTIVVPGKSNNGAPALGIYIQQNSIPGGGSRNSNSLVVNNLIVSPLDGTMIHSAASGPPEGVVIDHNLYFSHDARSFKVGSILVDELDFARWQEQGRDAHGRFVDPEIAKVGTIIGSAHGNYQFSDAAPGLRSPAHAMGIPEGSFSTNFAGEARKPSAWGVGAL